MAYTIEQVNALESAIAQGARKVKYSDKEIEYNSLGEMRAQLEIMMAELNVSAGYVTRRITTYSKGL